MRVVGDDQEVVLNDDAATNLFSVPRRVRRGEILRKHGQYSREGESGRTDQEDGRREATDALIAQRFAPDDHLLLYYLDDAFSYHHQSILFHLPTVALYEENPTRYSV